MITFNKGADFWYAHYYEDLGVCFTDPAAADNFGHFFSNKLNKKETIDKLCSSLSDIVNKNYLEFKGVSSFQDSCFVDGKIEYIKEFQYIRFPDFKASPLNELILRIDINPCVGKEDAMTKIYCIPRYEGSVTASETNDFFRRSKLVCKSTVDTLSEIYVKCFSEFANQENVEPAKIKKENLEDPYILVSSMAGSDDENTKKFFDLLDNPSEWEKYCKNNSHGKSILNFLSKMRKPMDNRWKLNEYEWYKNVVEFESSDDNHASNKFNQATGYVGFKKEGKQGHFIGISDSYPRDILLPIHLDIIQSGRKVSKEI